MSILWVIIGYSLAFSGDGSGLFGGFSKVFLDISDESNIGGIPEVLICNVSNDIRIITPALIIGAYVERIKFSVVLIFSSLWLLVVYCPVAYWVWGVDS